MLMVHMYETNRRFLKGTMCAGTHGGARERKSAGLVLAMASRPTPLRSYWRIKR